MPTKTALSRYFHLRMDHRNDGDLQKYIDFIRRLPGKDKLIVLEISKQSKKPHTHTIFFDERSENRLRTMWKEKFSDYKGKEDKEYQFKSIPDDELFGAEKYVCKGKDEMTQPDVLLQTGKYSIEYVIEKHKQWWEVNKQLCKSVVPDGTMNPYIQVIEHRVEKVVKPKKNFFNDLIQAIDLQYPDREWGLRDTPLLLRMLLKLHGKNFRPYGPQQIENEMNVLLNHYCYESHYADLYETLKNRNNIPHL